MCQINYKFPFTGRLFSMQLSSAIIKMRDKESVCRYLINSFTNKVEKSCKHDAMDIDYDRDNTATCLRLVK